MPKMSPETRKRVESLLRELAGTKGVDKIVAERVGASSETIRKIRSSMGLRGGSPGRPTVKEQAAFAKPADDLTREDRLHRLLAKMKTDPKYRQLSDMLDKKEIEVFNSEFLAIAQDMETLDAFEESHLYTAIMNFVIATRYPIEYKKQRVDYIKYIESGLPADDPMVIGDPTMRTVPPDEGLMVDFQKSLDLYNKVRDKFARIQEEKRKRVIADKKSFSDYNEYYQQEKKRREASMEIVDFNKKSDDELKRMIESGELMGHFE